MATRTECPDCGKDVAVNKDGSLRKHECVEVAEAPAEVTPELEAAPAEPPAEAPAEPEQPRQRPSKDPRLCAVSGCDRPNVLHRLCGAHYASRRGG